MSLTAYALRVLAGLALSVLIGLAAYQRRSLTRSGVVGAMLIGSLVFGLGGWVWGGLLIAFFVSSSALTHYQQASKAGLAEEFSQVGARDVWQVLANGGLAAGLAIAYSVYPHILWLFAFVGALAEANADTWATELGLLSDELPRMITSGRLATRGTSGAVTWDGLGAALLGAGFISTLAALFYRLLGESVSLAVALASVGALAGFVGALCDSLLGATLQGIFCCDTCHKQTEKPVHRCGSPTRPVRGWHWLNNEMVNMAGTFVGALFAAGVGALYML